MELGDAQQLLGLLPGSGIAPSLFAVALLACGLNSTVTAWPARVAGCKAVPYPCSSNELTAVTTSSIATVPLRSRSNKIRLRTPAASTSSNSFIATPSA